MTNFWKLFFYGFKREYCNKFIAIRGLLEIIAVYCFNNTITTYIGTLSNNTPSLDDIDNKYTVSTCRSLNCSSSSPHNSEIIRISDITIAIDMTTDIDRMDSKEVQLEGGGYNRLVSG